MSIIYLNQLFFTLLLIICLNFKSTIQSQDEKRLHEFLFNDGFYRSDVRPISDSSKTIHVDVKFILKRLYYVDEINHKVTLYAVLVKKWKDDFLTWNPKDYGYINFTYVHYSKIWTPQIELVSKYSNENNEVGKIKEVYDDYPIKIYSDGIVEFVPSVHLTTNCLFTYVNFPMDIQLCNLLFQTPYQKEQLEYHLEAIFDNKNITNAMWDVIDLNFMDIMDPLGNKMNNVLLSLKRKIKSYIYTIPSYIVYTMTLIMFLLPQTSSQRIVIGSSCLVMITMLTYMLSSSLPHNDIAAWPLLGKLYLFNSIMLTFSLLFSAYIINLSQTDHLKSVPNWLKKLTLNVLSRVFCIKSLVYAVFNSFDQKIYYEDELANIQTGLNGPNIQEMDEVTENNSKIKELFKKIYEHLQQIRYNYQRHSYKHNVNNEWLLIASILDRILFLFYTFIIIFSTFTILKSNK